MTMQCPTDGSALTMSERAGIEIDYCPSCRGVWLDRGELDKIIERSLTQQPVTQQHAAPAQQGSYSDPRYQQGYSNQGYYKKKRRESWLSELFD